MNPSIGLAAADWIAERHGITRIEALGALCEREASIIGCGADCPCQQPHYDGSAVSVLSTGERHGLTVTTGPAAVYVPRYGAGPVSVYQWGPA